MDKLVENYEVINVKQSNNLIQSLGKTTLLSNKVFLTALQKIENREGVSPKLRDYYKKLEAVSGADFTQGLIAEFSNAELRKIMGTNSGSYYTNIAELMDPQNEKSLIKQWVILVKDSESGIYGSTAVITSTVYDDKEGKMFIKFSSEKKIKKELYNLKNNYTLLNYNLMMQFKSVYTFKLYRLLMSRIGYQDGILKKKSNIYTFRYNLSELKYLLGILDPFITKEVRNALTMPNPDYEKIETHISTEKVMPRYADIKKSTFIKVKEEVDNNELSEFIFDYEPIRNGRGGKVTGVTLVMTRKKVIANKQDAKELTEEEKDDILAAIEELLRKYKLGFKSIRSIAVAAQYDINKVINAYKYAESQSKDIDNLVGFIIAAIKNNYEMPKTLKNKNKFCDFEQHDYDFELLEKELLGD